MLYAFIFAAAAALVDKVADVGTAVLPITVTLPTAVTAILLLAVASTVDRRALASTRDRRLTSVRRCSSGTPRSGQNLRWR